MGSLFAELKNTMQFVKHVILSDMVYEQNDFSETTEFTRHLYCTKFWFARVSWANKKNFLFALLEDTTCMLTLSLVLKSIWNSLTKDAIMSSYEQNPWSGFDRIPLDNNRTAIPAATLCQVMNSDRSWYQTLEPERQALVITELLSIAGGPLLRATLQRAQTIYDRSHACELNSIEESYVVQDPDQKGGVEKNDQYLANWNTLMKNMRNTLKLEELEVTLKDGSTKRIWKVNRPRPEALETADMIQLLPSYVAKKILAYLPRAQLPDYAKVNKYWAFLIEELKAEVAARAKIQVEMDRLREKIREHDYILHKTPSSEASFPDLVSPSTTIADPGYSQKRHASLSIKASEKSAYLNITPERLSRPYVPKKPIRNLREMTSRLEERGAADDGAFHWCGSILRKSGHLVHEGQTEGIVNLGNIHFPCPLLRYHIDAPLTTLHQTDPATSRKRRQRKIDRDHFSSSGIISADRGPKRFSLWSRDFSSLYPVLKVAAHQYPAFPAQSVSKTK